MLAVAFTLQFLPTLHNWALRLLQLMLYYHPRGTQELTDRD